MVILVGVGGWVVWGHEVWYICIQGGWCDEGVKGELRLLE